MWTATTRVPFKWDKVGLQFIRHSSILHVSVGLLAALVVLHADSAAQKAFGESLKGKAVLLKTPLYTIHYVSEGALGTSPKTYNQPIVVVSPKQTYYEAPVRNDVLTDEKPDRLVNQVAAKIGSRGAMQKAFGARDQDADRKVDLSTYELNERLEISKVEFDKTDVRVTLAKALGRNKKPVTGFTLRLDANISDGLSEEAEIRELLARVVASEP